MKVNVSHRTGYATIALEGRFTAVGAPVFRKAVTDLVGKDDVRIVVDLSQVAFIDSSGLGALIGSLKTARLAEGDLRIAAPTPAVSSVLRLTNLDRVLRAYPDPDSAFDTA